MERLLPIPIERWRIDIVERDDTRVLAGLVGGEPHVSAPLLAFLPKKAWARASDGTDYALGQPEPLSKPERVRRAMADLARIHRGHSPTPEELAAAPRLDAWAVAHDVYPPGLVGYVTGHPRLSDGGLICTSPVL